MNKYTLLFSLLLLSTVSRGQWSKQLVKIFDEKKFRELVDIAGRVHDYMSPEDEKGVDELVGRSYYALMMYDSAVYFESKAISMDNDATGVSGWGYTCRGMALYMLGKREESIRDILKAIDLNSNHNAVEWAKEFLDDIYANKVPDDSCKNYFQQGEYKNAIAQGRRQLQRQEYRTVLETVGAAYVEIHKYDSAIYFEHRALAADKDETHVSGWAHVYLGIALFQNGQKDEAIASFRKAVELNKLSGSVRTAENYLDAIINGRMISIDSLHQAIKDQLNKDNGYRAAANIAYTALARNPGDALAWDQLSAAYFWLHNFDSALYCGQAAIAMDKEQSLVSCEAHFNMGRARFMKNDGEGAANEFNAAINDRTSDNLRTKVTNARRQMGLTDTYDRWKTAETDDIIFHFQNKRSLDDAAAFMAKYEQEYASGRAILSRPLPRKIDVFVWERETLARQVLGNGKDVAVTYPEYCVAHVAQDNNHSSTIMTILGHWQKDE